MCLVVALNFWGGWWGTWRRRVPGDACPDNWFIFVEVIVELKGGRLLNEKVNVWGKIFFGAVNGQDVGLQCTEEADTEVNGCDGDR